MTATDGSPRPPGVPMSQWPSAYEYVLPTGAPGEVTLTIDGREVTAKAGELLIKVAQDHGTYVPRFCYHERMKPVGMCRMCLVEVEGMRGLQISCATVVADGMVVHTQSDAARQAQDGVLELLLINHPLDCPVCDRGGECPLQDTTLAFGPGESRFVEEKRHWEKPIPISDLVLLDRERCIQCGRCTRFADEIAGDALISFGGRGNHTEVITFPGDPFASYFSGNTVQICPVGALTATPYRFKARPWDLSAVETSCTTCAVQCRGALQSSSNRLVRLLGVDSEPVNHGWLCDKGRFGYELVDSDERVRAPMVRRGGELVECSWPEALDAAAAGIQRALDLAGPQSVALLGGARGTNEDAYAWARFTKGVVGTDNVDAQLADGLPASLALGLPAATIADVDRAAAVIVLGVDLKEELPVLYLRALRAADELGVPLVELAPRDQGLTKYASASLRYLPGEQGTVAGQLVAALQGGTPPDGAIAGAAQLLAGRDGDIVVILGRGDLAESDAATVQAASELARLDRTKFLVGLRRGNVRGALDLGLTPGFLPGRVTLDAGRDWFTERWGSVPATPGLDARGILEAAQQGRIHALVILGADPQDDCPDHGLAESALNAAGFTIAVDAFVTDSTKRADVFLPVTMWGEKLGSATNLEGRVQRLGAAISPEGSIMPDWRIAAELALRLGRDFDLETVEEVQDEIAAVAPAHAGVDAALLRRARDGAVIPIAEHRDELVLGPVRIPVTSVSWEPITSRAPDADLVGGSHGADLVAASGTGAAATILPGLSETATEPDDPELEAVEAQADEAAAPAATTDPRPDLHRYTGPAPTPDTPRRDAYALRLVTGRTLYDAGITVAASGSLAGLPRDPQLLVHPHDRDRIGVEDGAEVRVTSARGSLTLPLRADDAIELGTAFLPFNLPGEGVGDLVQLGAAVTDLRVESRS